MAIVDTLATGKRAYVNPEAALYEIDIRNPALAAAFEAVRPDAVFHVAAHASVSESVATPCTTRR